MAQLCNYGGHSLEPIRRKGGRHTGLGKRPGYGSHKLFQWNHVELTPILDYKIGVSEGKTYFRPCQ